MEDEVRKCYTRELELWWRPEMEMSLIILDWNIRRSIDLQMGLFIRDTGRTI